MTKPQFIRIETYALNKVGKKLTIQQLVDEAFRSQKKSCKHVTMPMAPFIAFKGHADPLRMVASINEMVALNELKTGRKTPINANLLLAGVSSYPELTAVLEGDEEVLKHFKFWSDCVLNFLHAEYKLNLSCVLYHFDELYPHCHFWVKPVVSKGKLTAIALHPGKRAHNNFANFKKQAEKALKHMEEKGIDTKPSETALKGLYKLGHKGLFKAAMTEYQDRAYEAIGKPCGFTKCNAIKRKRFVMVPGFRKPQARDDDLNEWILEHATQVAVAKSIRLDRMLSIPAPKLKP